MEMASISLIPSPEQKEKPSNNPHPRTAHLKERKQPEGKSSWIDIFFSLYWPFFIIIIGSFLCWSLYG